MVRYTGYFPATNGSRKSARTSRRNSIVGREGGRPVTGRPLAREKPLLADEEDHGHDHEDEEQLERGKEKRPVGAQDSDDEGTDERALEIAQAADDRDDESLDDHRRSDSRRDHAHWRPDGAPQGRQHRAENEH